MHPVKVVHRNLLDAETGPMDPGHQLDTDEAGVVFEPNAIEYGAADEAEVAVDVPDR